MNLPRRRLVLTALAALSLVGCDKIGWPASKASFNGVDITGADYGHTLSLPDQNGTPRTLADFKARSS